MLAAFIPHAGRIAYLFGDIHDIKLAETFSKNQSTLILWVFMLIFVGIIN